MNHFLFKERAVAAYNTANSDGSVTKNDIKKLNMQMQTKTSHCDAMKGQYANQMLKVIFWHMMFDNLGDISNFINRLLLIYSTILLIYIELFYRLMMPEIGFTVSFCRMSSTNFNEWKKLE